MSDPNGHRLGAVIVVIAAFFLLGLQPGPSAEAAIIGHWTFNDDTADDSSGNGNHGVPQGGFTYVDVNGNPDNRGISLDGDNGSQSGINFGSPAAYNFTNNDFSIAAWIAIDTTSANGNNEWVIGKSDSSYRLGYEQSGKRHNLHLFGGLAKDAAVNSADPANSFHHVVMVKSTASQTALYLDGACVSCATPSNGFNPIADNSGSDLQAGFGGGNALLATYDELVIYDTYLSSAEILDIYEAGPTFTPSVVSTTVLFDATFATEFTSQQGVTYSLECTTNLVTSNGWSATGTFVDGNGTNMFLFDPSGFSTAKLYRVSIAP
jgi:hypothetical protein